MTTQPDLTAKDIIRILDGGKDADGKQLVKSENFFLDLTKLPQLFSGTRFYKCQVLDGKVKRFLYFNAFNLTTANSIGDVTITKEQANSDDNLKRQARMYSDIRLSIRYHKEGESADARALELISLAFSERILDIAQNNQKVFPVINWDVNNKLHESYKVKRTDSDFEEKYQKALAEGTITEEKYAPHNKSMITEFKVRLPRENHTVPINIPTEGTLKVPNATLKVKLLDLLTRTSSGLPVPATVDGVPVNDNNIHKFITYGSEVSGRVGVEVIVSEKSGISIKYKFMNQEVYVKRNSYVKPDHSLAFADIINSVDVSAIKIVDNVDVVSNVPTIEVSKPVQTTETYDSSNTAEHENDDDALNALDDIDNLDTSDN